MTKSARKPGQIANNSGIWKDFRFILILCAAILFFVGYTPMRNHTLYWDNAFLFSFFRDNLYSLNRWGEFMWWYPHTQFGWNGHYFALLGCVPVLSLSYIFLAVAAFILGRLGLEIQQGYFYWYYFYFAFLSPLIYLTGVYFFAKHFFSDRRVLYTLLALAACSPGVVLNISDMGYLESVGYSSFFCAAFLTWIYSPTKRSWLFLVLGTFLLALNLNYSFLFFNVVAIPTFIFSILFFSPGSKRKFFNALAKTTYLEKSFLIVGTVLCAAPAVITEALMKGSLQRTTLDNFSYSVMNLKPGNALEFLATSFPAVGLNYIEGAWSFERYTPGNYNGFFYMSCFSGAILLSAFFLVKERVRRIVLTIGVCFFGMVVLVSYSPWFSTVLELLYPLRSNSHFNDGFFRAGGYLFVLFGIGFGLNALVSVPKNTAQLFFRTFLILLPVIVLVLFRLKGDFLFGDPLATAALLFAGFMVLCLKMIIEQKDGSAKQRWYIKAFMILMVLDVSTAAFGFMRMTSHKAVRFDSHMGSDPIRFALAGAAANMHANNLIGYPGNVSLNSVEFPSVELPVAFLSNSLRSALTPAEEKVRYKEEKEKYLLTLPILKPEESRHELVAKFLNQPPRKIEGQIEEQWRNFNDWIVQVDSKATESSLLFLKNGYDPKTTYKVNGEVVSPINVMYNYVAVVVPPGKSIVEFSYHPRLLKLTIVAALTFMFFFIGYVIFSTSDPRRLLGQISKSSTKHRRRILLTLALTIAAFFFLRAAAPHVIRFSAKAYINSVDFENLKQKSLRELQSVNEEHHRKSYAQIQDEISSFGVQPQLEKLGLKSDLTKNEAIELIKDMKKENVLALVDDLPNEAYMKLVQRFLLRGR